MNGGMIGGIIVNALVVLAVGALGEYPAKLAMVLAVPVALSVLGAILVGVGQRKVGAWLVMIGCVVFVPIGLIGALGGRKVLDQLRQEEFEAGG
jgi:hypothetical membrane protein